MTVLKRDARSVISLQYLHALKENLTKDEVVINKDKQKHITVFFILFLLLQHPLSPQILIWSIAGFYFILCHPVDEQINISGNIYQCHNLCSHLIRSECSQSNIYWHLNYMNAFGTLAFVFKNKCQFEFAVNWNKSMTRSDILENHVSKCATL